MRPHSITFAILIGLFACDNAPAEAIVVNEHEGITLEKVWFRTTTFFRPIDPGSSSDALRVGTGVEHAYAVLRIGQDDPDGGPKAKRYVARTRQPIDAEPAKTVRIVFSPAAAQSLCFGQPPLTKDEWDFITSRIFPEEAIDAFDRASCE